MILSNETWPLSRICFQIQDSINIIETSFQKTNGSNLDRMVKWNQDNHQCHILNVDGSCMGSPVRAGFGGVLRNNAGLYLSGFSGFIPDSTDILLAELSAVHRGYQMAKAMGIQELVCYSDSLLSINLITGQASSYHVYAVLIQDIKDLMSAHNFTLRHCLREGNQCADFMAKLGASSNEGYQIHASPPNDLLDYIRNDAIGTLYPRA
jgi:ribonuclease HI